MENLKRCLCGGQATLGHVEFNTVVYCKECGMQTGLRDSDEYAIKIWNDHNSIIVKCGDCTAFDTRGYNNRDCYDMPELRMGYCNRLRKDVQALMFCWYANPKK